MAMEEGDRLAQPTKPPVIMIMIVMIIMMGMIRAMIVIMLMLTQISVILAMPVFRCHNGHTRRFLPSLERRRLLAFPGTRDRWGLGAAHGQGCLRWTDTA